MTVAPSPANPELLRKVSEVIYEEIFNEFNPPEQSTTLEGLKEHRVWENRQHLPEGLTARDFQVLVDKCLDVETAALFHAYGRIQELLAAAHPRKKEAS
ncbi:hypothetical protein [Prochlorococcus sp. MIT 1306]|uniref:hypothetical protein n=1 Tax=Prochlorococcus sp. MIT 1306 TaxID=1799667 RepID=UPI0007B33651|nr:hypothetical protein [Prochlorococcus sp. MIT 1306]KZR63152.1 hypothetical protein PMIT1306_01635 [Prochlorococcus sp. MIT 1306]